MDDRKLLAPHHTQISKQEREQLPERRSSRGYRPLAHRTVPLLLLGAIVLGLIGALEHALHVLPQVSFSSQDGAIGVGATGLNSAKLRRSLDARATSSAVYIVPRATSDSTTTKGAAAPHSKSAIATSAATPTPDAYHGGQATTVDAPAVTTSPEGTEPTTAAGAYDGGDAVTAPAAKGTDTSITGEVSASLPESAYRGQSDTTIVVPITTTGLSGDGSGPSGAIETLITSAASEAAASYQGTVVTTQSVLVGGSTITTEQDGMRGSTSTTDSKSTTSTKSHLARPSNQAVIPDVIESGMPLAWIKETENYFLGVYAPVLLAIGLRLLLEYVYRCTKLISPFYMLTRQRGSTIPELFSANHLGSNSILTPYRAIKTRNWILFWAAILDAGAQLITIFASELISVRLVEDQSQSKTNLHIVRAYAICINTPLARTVQGLLVFVFIQLVNIWCLARRERTMLRANPAGIAAVASVFGNAETGHDILGISSPSKPAPADGPPNGRYQLRTYINHQGEECYGVVPEDFVSPERYYDKEFEKSGQFMLDHSSSWSSMPPQDLKSRLKRFYRHDMTSLTLLSITTTTLFGLILAYTVNGASTPFEMFMDSEGFGPRFLLSILGMTVKSPLVDFRARAVAEAPFRRLMTPRRGRLDLQAPVPLTALGSIPYAFRRYEWYLGGLAIAAGILIELLLILLPGVPFQAQQSFRAAQVSWFGSLACLGLILTVAVCGWIRLFTNAQMAQWPRMPTTVGAVASYVACTDMAADCAAQNTPIRMDDAHYQFCLTNGRWRIDYADTQRS